MSNVLFACESNRSQIEFHELKRMKEKKKILFEFRKQTNERDDGFESSTKLRLKIALLDVGTPSSEHMNFSHYVLKSKEHAQLVARDTSCSPTDSHSPAVSSCEVCYLRYLDGWKQ